MRFHQMIEGLQILAKYEKDGLETHLNGADHDVIWACTADVDPAIQDQEERLERGEVIPDRRISPEDAKRLELLGWFVSPEYADAWSHYL